MTVMEDRSAEISCGFSLKYDGWTVLSHQGFGWIRVRQIAFSAHPHLATVARIDSKGKLKSKISHHSDQHHRKWVKRFLRDTATFPIEDLSQR
jgi:hypothetical protein